jgi:cell division protein FtsW (lipid II flippase)
MDFKLMKIKKPTLINFSSLVFTLVISLIMIKLDTAPFVLIGLIWIAEILFLSLRSKRNFIKIIGVNLSAALFALTLFETYQWFKTGELFINKSKSIENFRSDKFLGFTPVENCKINENKYYKGKLIFNVTYTIDKNGLRIRNNGCILFSVAHLHWDRHNDVCLSGVG